MAHVQELRPFACLSDCLHHSDIVRIFKLSEEPVNRIYLEDISESILT